MPSSQCQSDVLDPARAQALATLLQLPYRFVTGSELPPFFHQIYFWQAEAAAELGRDGHPRVGAGGLIPDMGLPRRMWAGGRLRFCHALSAGQEAKKTSVCEGAVRKKGRTGPLALVTLRHEFSQAGTLCVTEWQDLVYREDPHSDTRAPKPVVAPGGYDTVDKVAFNSTALFRYSALTFNGHRIHYDLPYAQNTEGYPGLVVHGPLLAQCLMLKAVAELGPLSDFAFRATAPLIADEEAQLCRSGHELWVRGQDGRQCMTATAQAFSE